MYGTCRCKNESKNLNAKLKLELRRHAFRAALMTTCVAQHIAVELGFVRIYRWSTTGTHVVAVHCHECLQQCWQSWAVKWNRLLGFETVFGG